MNVQVSERWGRFIESQVRSGRYRSEDEVLDEALSLLHLRDQAEDDATQHVPPVNEPLPPWKQVLETMRAVPDEEFDRIPVDSAEQLDHYLYGSPKRPTG